MGEKLVVEGEEIDLDDLPTEEQLIRHELTERVRAAGGRRFLVETHRLLRRGTWTDDDLAAIRTALAELERGKDDVVWSEKAVKPEVHLGRVLGNMFYEIAEWSSDGARDAIRQAFLSFYCPPTMKVKGKSMSLDRFRRFLMVEATLRSRRSVLGLQVDEVDDRWTSMHRHLMPVDPSLSELLHDSEKRDAVLGFLAGDPAFRDHERWDAIAEMVAVLNLGPKVAGTTLRTDQYAIREAFGFAKNRSVELYDDLQNSVRSRLVR
jgi:hypothetical protein